VRRTPDPSMSELLDNIRALRLTLTADLAAVAGALDEDEPGIARDIVAADCHEVQRLSSGGSQPHRALPASPRRRRALLALPAIPLIGVLAMTGAAALSHHDATHSHPHSHRTAASRTATTTLHQLERVVSSHPQESQVITVADYLHHQLTAMIATSIGSPERLGDVQQMLSVEQRLLEGQRGPGETIALAASRKLTLMLTTDTAPVVVVSTLTSTSAPTPTATPIPTSMSTPTAMPTPTSVPTPAAVPTSAAPQSVQHSTPPSPHHTPTPKPKRSHRHRHRHSHHARSASPIIAPAFLDKDL
jgi:hypothetical protein